MKPCPCECNYGAFCGGCGHAGCGGRQRARGPQSEDLHPIPVCEVCGAEMSVEEIVKNPSVCSGCVITIDRETEALLEREPFDWFE
jgi:hypothetical protein